MDNPEKIKNKIQVCDGIFIPNINYEYPRELSNISIDTEILKMQVMWRLEEGKKGFFRHEYKKDEIDLHKNLYASVASILISYAIGEYKEYKQRKNRVVRQLKKHFLKMGKYYFSDYHLTAKLVLSLNLLGEYYPKTYEKIPELEFQNYLDNKIDWSNTLKDLWGACAISFGNTAITVDKKNELRNYLFKKFENILAFSLNDIPRIRISKIYHFVSALDFIGIEYPIPVRVIDTLLGEDYLSQRTTCERTVCTDFDFAYILTKYGWQSGYAQKKIHSTVSQISEIIVNDWDDSIDYFKEYSIPHMYDYLISISVFQKLFANKFCGRIIADIHHSTFLYKSN